MSGGFVLFGIVASLFVNAPVWTTALWVYMILYGSTGFPNAAAGVGMQATMQQICPPRVMGRAGGVSSAIFTGGMALGALMAGVATEFTTARTLLNIQAATLSMCGVLGFLFVVRRISAVESIS